jgi:glycosyltransferase involved in cell wall biosynthesis
VSPAFFPATRWGGPIFSLAFLCRALADAGAEVQVLTTDSAGPRISDRVDVHADRAPLDARISITYTRRLAGVSISPGLLARLAPAVKWADVVHLTGVYSFPTIPTLIACRMLGKPLVWSPRGALQLWSESSRLRLKSAWNALCRALVRGMRVAMHVTSQEELEESKARMPGLRQALIPNGVVVPGTGQRTWRPHGRLRLLFLGRLDPKKGVENLLAALPLLRSAQAELTIRGAGDARYLRSLEDLAGRLALIDRVHFGGYADDAAKHAAFMSADLCVVPSHTENFGLVIAEALAHGVPVIASRGTPWRELPARGCGMWVDNSPQSLALAIDELCGRDLEMMGRRGREWMQRDYQWAAIAERTIELYRELSADGHA